MTCLLTGDQTPTPTRFLKSCEELGLFQEFTRNPFDEEFRKATYQAVSASSEVKTLIESQLLSGLCFFVAVNLIMAHLQE